MRTLLIALLGAGLAGAATAQTLKQVSGTIAPAQQGQSEPAPTLRATANLVVVDVVVREKDGHAIQGLKQSDFVLLEDKAAQRVNHFEEHTSAEIGPAAAAKPVMPAGVFTNIEPVAARGPLNILLFDRFNTQMKSQSMLRLQLLKFIDTAKPGTQMEILDLGDRIRVLQGFTDDKELLRSVLKDRNSPVMADFEANSNVPNDSTASGIVGESPDQVSAGAPMSSEGITHPSLSDETNLAAAHIRSMVMESTMRFLAIYLGNLPGRKNLLWFSGTYPFHLFPDKDLLLPWQLPAEDYQRAAAKLAESQVSVYPIGLHAMVMKPSEDMDELARETGGRAYYNANAVDEITAEAIEDGSSYYTLAYAPADANWNGAYRNIEVKLADGRSAELSYRRGYYANDPSKPVKTAIFGSEKPTKDARPDAMQMALMLGVPDAAQIVFTARVQPEAGMEKTLAAGNEGSKGLKGPYQRYVVQFSVDAHDLQLMEAGDGLRHGEVEIVVFVYDPKGSVVNGVGRSARIDVKPDVYEKLLRGGLPLELDVSVPVKGEYTLRVAAHDLTDDHVGSVEVPVAAVAVTAK